MQSQIVSMPVPYLPILIIFCLISHTYTADACVSRVGGKKICQCLYRLDYNTAYVVCTYMCTLIPRPLKCKDQVSCNIGSLPTGGRI